MSNIITTLAAAVIGALLVITTFAFGGDTADWIAFGLAVAGLGTAAVAARSQRLLAAGIGLVSAWTVLVALGIFSGATQTWLIFAGGAAVAAAGVLGNAREARRQPALASVADLKAA